MAATLSALRPVAGVHRLSPAGSAPVHAACCLCAPAADLECRHYGLQAPGRPGPTCHRQAAGSGLPRPWRAACRFWVLGATGGQSDPPNPWAWSDAQPPEVSDAGGSAAKPLLPDDRVRSLVEGALLAACSGLSFYLSTLFRVETYLGAFFPFPLVVLAFRWGPAAAVRALVTTVLLVGVLGGPLRAAVYVMMHGGMAITLGYLWTRGCPWAITVPAAIVARTVGVAASLGLTSLVMRENLLLLAASQALALLDHGYSALGLLGAPSPRAVYALIAILVVINSAVYAFLLHVLYALLLGSLQRAGRLRGGRAVRVPLFFQRMLDA